MREVLFRAWDKIGKGYIQGFNMCQFHLYYNKGLPKHVFRYHTKWNLEDIILEQYTGFKDRKQVYIFEGDILKSKKFDNLKVIWGYGCWATEGYEGGSSGVPLYSVGDDSYYRDGVEVIGNINARPELLTPIKE